MIDIEVQKNDIAGNPVQSDPRLIEWGYALLGVSFLLYGIVDFGEFHRNDENLTIFFVHYIIALVYTGILLFHKSLGVVKSWKAEHIDMTAILLNLFLISAFALNRELPVFENSTTWLCAYLLLSSLTILSFRFFPQLPRYVNAIQYIMIGSAITLYIYLTIYCGNYFVLGAIGILAFGIGGHILVPVFLVITSMALIRSSKKVGTVSYAWIGVGSGIPIMIAAIFVIVWTIRINEIEKKSNLSVLASESELPTWVSIAQNIENDWISDKILKSELVYTVSNNHFGWDFFPRGLRWNESRKHDPLVFISSLVKRITLSNEERISILKAITTNRHNAEDRLWSGKNLSTSYIVTDVDIYPELRLAYSENYFTIHNSANAQRWPNPEEAIFTFQLPEGSVVTSLSLWINGREEKGILTSKQKATEAYNAIVGVERRDPSVVHWQEGNTVTVRVFPCTPNEERKFKIGITSPLPEEGGRLSYSGIKFRGPDASDAEQTFRLRFIGNPEQLDLPQSFTKNPKGEYISEQEHDPTLKISFSTTKIKANKFSFDGDTYSLGEYKPSFQPAEFSGLYLDLNNTWSQEELQQLQPLIKSHKVHVFFEDQFMALSESNWSEMTSALIRNNFSIFPFHKIGNIQESLVITKGKDLSPFLIDFKESKFAEGVTNFFSSKQKVYVFNITSSMSTYIRSLKELRGFNFASGSVADLKNLLQQKHFPLTPEDDQRIVLHDSKMVIEKKSNTESPANNAPDHLLRLFAYNDIMRQVGTNYFKNDYINKNLVNEASKAYVVSPVSSLIVLETKEDYERFEIVDNENSLHNASKQSSGAVPEPHEWFLIIIFACLVLFCIYKQRTTRSMLAK